MSRGVSYRILIKAFSVLNVNVPFTFGRNMFRPSITAFLSLGVFTHFFMHLSLAHSDLTMKEGSKLTL